MLLVLLILLDKMREDVIMTCVALSIAVMKSHVIRFMQMMLTQVIPGMEVINGKYWISNRNLKSFSKKSRRLKNSYFH